MKWSVLLLVLMSGCLAPEVLPPGGPPGEPCGHSTCAGCCDNGVCVSGYHDEACGLLGRACDACGVQAMCGPSRACVPAAAPREDGGWSTVESPLEGDKPPSGPVRRCYSIGSKSVCE